MPTLYPFQEASVQHMLAQPRPLRWLEGSEMGLGKSIMAIETMKRLEVRTLLTVTLGSVRKDWERYMATWWPRDVGVISYGRTVKLSRKKDERRSWAYLAHVQIVSYELLKHVSLEGWDGIIFDEIHECVSYRSATSKRIREFRDANPNAHILCLTGTPLTTEPSHAWNILDILDPGAFGKPTAGGDPPYKFMRGLCESVPNEYAYSGSSFKGLSAAGAPLLKKLLSRYMSRTLAADVAGMLPPIDFRAYLADQDDKRSDMECVQDKIAQMGKESNHVLVTTWNHTDLEALWAVGPSTERPAFFLTGETPKRAELLQRAAALPQSIIYATIDCISTGIDLRFVQQYLIAQPIARIHTLLQFDGRFRRLGEQVNTLPTIGWMYFREGQDDDVRRKITSRMAEYTAAIRTATETANVASAVAIVPSPERLRKNLDRILASFDDSGEDSEEDTTL